MKSCKFIFLGLLAFSLLSPVGASAAYFAADNDVILTTNDELVEENAYLAGNTISVIQNIGGDIFAAGGTVIISSSEVDGDITAAANVLSLTEVSAEDARLAGNNISFGANLEGELLVAGAQINILPQASVAGDARLMGASIVVNGSFDGDLVIRGGQSVTIGPSAVILGNLEYSAPKKASINSAAQISGEVNFKQIEKSRHQKDGLRGNLAWVVFGLATFFSLIKWLSALIAVFLLWYFLRRDSLAVLQSSLTRFGFNLLRGFLFILVIPPVMLILALTGFALPIAFFVGLVYATLLMLALPFTILLVAAFINKRNVALRWFHLLFAAIILFIVCMVPVLGWLAAFIMYLPALGALLGLLASRFRPQSNASTTGVTER